MESDSDAEERRRHTQSLGKKPSRATNSAKRPQRILRYSGAEADDEDATTEHFDLALGIVDDDGDDEFEDSEGEGLEDDASDVDEEMMDVDSPTGAEHGLDSSGANAPDIDATASGNCDEDPEVKPYSAEEREELQRRYFYLAPQVARKSSRVQRSIEPAFPAGQDNIHELYHWVVRKNKLYKPGGATVPLNSRHGERPPGGAKERIPDTQSRKEMRVNGPPNLGAPAPPMQHSGPANVANEPALTVPWSHELPGTLPNQYAYYAVPHMPVNPMASGYQISFPPNATPAYNPAFQRYMHEAYGGTNAGTQLPAGHVIPYPMGHYQYPHPHPATQPGAALYAPPRAF